METTLIEVAEQPAKTIETKPSTGPLEVSKGAAIELDAERVVTFIDRGHAYTFHFHRLTAEDWNGFFQGVHMGSHNEGALRVTVIDTDTAALELLENRLAKTEGYIGRFMEKAGWQKMIPPRHARPLSWLLRAVSPSAKAESEAPFDPERMEILLDAAWGMAKPGEMKAYSGLAHYFEPPTAEQKKRYYRATSESRVVGGSRKGRTVFASKEPLLVKLYDEMVHSVQGYSCGGHPLTGVENIRREMDAYHKAIAVQQVFSGVVENDGEGEAEEE